MEKQKKILFIEDSKDLLKLVSTALQGEDFEVLTATTGEQGLEIALREKIDLILLDLELPGIKGLEVLKKLRENEKGAETPVIIFSNIADTSNLSTAVEYGVYEYLIKSDWELPDLVTKIKSMLKV